MIAYLLLDRGHRAVTVLGRRADIVDWQPRGTTARLPSEGPHTLGVRWSDVVSATTDAARTTIVENDGRVAAWFSDSYSHGGGAITRGPDQWATIAAILTATCNCR